MKVAINGFGRIGKQFFLACMEQNVPWEFVINDISSLDTIVYSLKYDSVHPSPKEEVSRDLKNLHFGKKKIRVYQEKDLENLPWKKEKVDLVVECTGLFTKKSDAMKHIKTGAKKVLISAPAEDSDCTLIQGVNAKALKKTHTIISAGSCTTNCVSPMVKILHDFFKVKSCFFTTTHAYTSTQKLIDSFDKKDFRRGRSASQNIIPTTSGAAQSVVESIPELKGKLDGFALRVPVVDGSISTVVAVIEKKTNKEEINRIFKNQAQKDYKDILGYAEDPIVSSDIIHDSHSCIFDPSLTSVTENLISISGWYDNEWGYSNRLVDVAKILLAK